MKNEYELIFIVRIDPSEEVMNQTVEEVKNFVEQDDMGTVTKIDRWGRRRLAYEIGKHREGYYVLFDAEIDPSHINELERELRLSQSIIRFLVIRKDD